MQLLQGASMNSNDSNQLQYNVGDLVYWGDPDIGWSYGIVCDSRFKYSSQQYRIYWFDAKRFEWNVLTNYDIINISHEQRKRKEKHND